MTGVSTGALLAPLVFLGPEYDAALTDVYTNIDPSKIFEKRFILAALTEDALRIQRHFTKPFPALS
ncbi:MAG TPA: patatin, partial [Methylocella sp.]|nr:patatin [Methylocella sp.]